MLQQLMWIGSTKKSGKLLASINSVKSSIYDDHRLQDFSEARRVRRFFVLGIGAIWPLIKRMSYDVKNKKI